MTEYPNKPQMLYATKAILASHPNARIRATLDFILLTAPLAQHGKRLMDALDTPGFIADGPESQQYLNQIFGRIETRFVELFGEGIPK